MSSEANSFTAARWAHELLTGDPGRFLLVCDGKRVTAATLAEEVGRFRAALNSCGIGGGQIVAISAERTVSAVAVLLASFCEGALPFLVDARQDHDILAKLFDAQRISGLYCGVSLDANGYRARLPYLRWVGESGTELQVSRVGAPEFAETGEFYLHSAGTCALPRALQHSASAIEWQANSLKAALRLSSKTEVWFTGSLALSSVFALGLCAALSAGGTLVLDDPAQSLSAAPRAEDVQRILLMSQASDVEVWTADKLLSVKGKLSALMTADVSLTETYANTLAQATDAAVWNGYSLAEASGFLSINLVPGVWPPDSIGRPIGGAEIEVRAREGVLARFGELGKLAYLHAPAPNRVVSLTFQTRNDVRLEGNATGDWGVHDGNDFLYVKGCENAVFFRAGFPVDAGFVESNVRSLEGVAECLIYAAPDDDVESEVVGAVVASSGETDINRVSNLAPEIPRYMWPVRLERVNALPRTPTGKLVRFGLPVPTRGQSSHRDSKTQTSLPASPQADVKMEE